MVSKVLPLYRFLIVGLAIPMSFPADQSVGSQNDSVGKNIIQNDSDALNVSETTTNEDNWEDNVTIPTMETTTTVSETTAEISSEDSTQRTRNLASKICFCDLTRNSCDVNCCCDSDCSEEDKRVFSRCKLGRPQHYDSHYCIHDQLLSKNNTPYQAHRRGADMLCIITDNLKTQHYFPKVQDINSREEFIKMVGRVNRPYSWDQRLKLENLPEMTNTEGALILVEKDGYAHPFELPSSFASDECRVWERISYLRNYQNECRIQLRSPGSECGGEQPLLSVATYSNMSFVGYPHETVPEDDKIDINETFDTLTSVPTTAESDAIVDTSTPESQTNNSGSFTNLISEMDSPSDKNSRVQRLIPPLRKFEMKELFTSIPAISFICRGNPSAFEGCHQVEEFPSPSYENGRCNNVLKRIHLTILHDGIYGIKEVIVKVQLTSLSLKTTSLVQEYKIDFKWIKDNITELFRRSGVPGYIQGNPILMGYLQTNKTLTDEPIEAENWIHLSSNPSEWLTILATGSDKLCNRRVPVNFNENLYSSCRHLIPFHQMAQSCDSLRREVIELLLGSLLPLENRPRIGVLGDSVIHRLEEWIIPTVSAEFLIESEGELQNKGNRTQCTNIISSLTIEIAFAYQGSFDTPQAKIIGMIAKPGYPQLTIQSPYLGESGGSSTPLRDSVFLDLSTTVLFIDVTKEAEIQYPEAPSLDFKLPYDFFYPLLPSGGGRINKYNCNWGWISLLLLLSSVSL